MQQMFGSADGEPQKQMCFVESALGMRRKTKQTLDAT